MKELKAGRKNIVKSVRVVNFQRADSTFFSDHEDEKALSWHVLVSCQEGFKPLNVQAFSFQTEAEAVSCMASFKIGAELPDYSTLRGADKSKLREFIELKMDAEKGRFCGLGNIGDEESPLAFDALDAAGITTPDGYNLTPAVRNFLGKQRIGQLKSLHRDNWRAAAVYEYCWVNLPHSSIAFAAAAYQFHHYISGDEMSAGYYWRDLEVLAAGIEQTAAGVVETRRRAGDGGSAKSIQARKDRIESLMEAIEAVCARNPDIAGFGCELVAKTVITHCEAAAPTLWRNGKGQVGEYLGEIRRGEAGSDLQARFRKLFPEKPPKRLDRSN